MSKKSSSTSETEETTIAEAVQEAAVTTGETVTAETSENTAETASSETTENSTPEAKEAEKSAESTESKTAETTVAKEKRYGLVRFLQINPVSSYEEALLRSECAMEVMTISEWLAKLQTILNRKVR